VFKGLEIQENGNFVEFGWVYSKLSSKLITVFVIIIVIASSRERRVAVNFPSEIVWWYFACALAG